MTTEEKLINLLSNDFSPFKEPVRPKFDEMPDIAKKIVHLLKKEEGLTYVAAYGILQCVYKYLNYESNFVSLQNKEDDYDHI